MLRFYQDVLYERFHKVEPIVNITASLTPKKRSSTFGYCSIAYPKCKNRVQFKCDNLRCEKKPCPEHSSELCENCANSSDFRKFTISSKTLKVNAAGKSRRFCQISKCQKKSTVLCSVIECKKCVCKTHRRKICNDCKNAQSSPNLNVFTRKSPKIKNKLL